MLVPHYGAPFEGFRIFTDFDKAMSHWRFLKNRECVEILKLCYDPEIDSWVY